MNKIYTCDCGKQFNNSQSFNGHQGRCKIHMTSVGKLDQYEKAVDRDEKNLQKALESFCEKHKNQKEIDLKKWIEEKHVCEHCGKILTEYYGTGRFCSVKCANARVHSQKTKDKISNSLKKKSPQNRKNKQFSEYNRIIKGKRLAEKIKLKDSPYSEFDCAYIHTNHAEGRAAYRFSKYDSNNKLVKMCIVLQYRYVIECELGRKLYDYEVIHHIDGDETNNSLSNLQVMSRSEHSKFHRLLQTNTQ